MTEPQSDQPLDHQSITPEFILLTYSLDTHLTLDQLASENWEEVGAALASLPHLKLYPFWAAVPTMFLAWSSAKASPLQACRLVHAANICRGVQRHRTVPLTYCRNGAAAGTRPWLHIQQRRFGRRTPKGPRWKYFCKIKKPAKAEASSHLSEVLLSLVLLCQ